MVVMDVSDHAAVVTDIQGWKVGHQGCKVGMGEQGGDLERCSEGCQVSCQSGRKNCAWGKRRCEGC